jgi:hypothetical protein
VGGHEADNTGVVISEPSTLITDYMLGSLTAVLAWRLLVTNRRRPQRAVRFWSAALMAVAFGSIVGGTYHGFALALTSGVAAALWKATMLAMGVASLFLTLSAIQAAAPPRLRRLLVIAAFTKLCVYAAWVFSHDEFKYVIMEYGSTLLLVLVLVGANKIRGETGHRVFIAGGILVSIVAALIQQSGVSLHAHFNHNDLMHVVQMGAVWLLFEGGRRLLDAEEA